MGYCRACCTGDNGAADDGVLGGSPVALQFPAVSHTLHTRTMEGNLLN